jgi:hypothetical protein
LKKHQLDHPGKLKYVGIEFNSSSQVLKTIAVELKGISGVAYNPEQLTDLFLKSIEVIDYNEPSAPVP